MTLSISDNDLNFRFICIVKNSYLSVRVKDGSCCSPSLLRAFATSIVLWVGWRLWRFTLSTWLNPSVPMALPYTLPFFGHVWGMTVSAAQVFRDGSSYFRNSRDPWSLAILGEETYIVTSPSDVLAVYRNTAKLDPDKVIKDVLGQFGVTQENVNKLFDRHGTPKHTMDHFHELFKSIYSVAPTILEDFFAFDNEAWKLPYKYPKFAAKSLYASKARCEAAFAAYLALPKERRSDASWIVTESQKAIEDMGIVDPTQCGAMLFSLHRVTNPNAYRLCFWSMAHLLYNVALLDAIKAEMAPAVNGSSVDMSYLLDKCSHLASFYEEILLTVGGKVLQPGRNLLMPYRLMHHDPTVFGADVAQFDSTRFLRNNNLYRSSSWKPFGGGTMYCPGRFLAKREVYLFLALMLPPGVAANAMPALDETIPAGGILPPVQGSDVIVDVSLSR
ncbi:cytochrome P450 [Nemania sp. NC0429]|nr:cytochrome P450 [Nemania sp. NC0429]